MKKIFMLYEVLFLPIYFLIVVFSYYCVSNYLASGLLIFISIFNLFMYRKIYNKTFNSKGIFSFAWLFTIGLSCLMLHPLQIKWKIETWLCLFVTIIFFNIGYNIKSYNNESSLLIPLSEKSIFKIIRFILILSLVTFAIELKIEGYLPFLSKNMGSYREFGLSGIHYITVSCCLIPSFCIIYFMNYFNINRIGKNIFLIISIIYSLLVPILIVSRQLLIMEIVISTIVLILLKRKRLKLRTKIIIGFCIIIGIVGWNFISDSRNQNDEYIRESLMLGNNSEFTVKQLQIYTYIACNYDNFNYNVNNTEKHTYGYKSLFPVFALTGTKFLFNLDEITYKNFMKYYTTMPIVINPYLDFGIFGIIIYMLILGFICKKVDKKDNENLFCIIQKGIVYYSLIFTFFYPTFSTPNIIFMLIYSYIVCLLFAKIKIKK